MRSSDIICRVTVEAEKLLRESGETDGEIILSAVLSYIFLIQAMTSPTSTTYALAGGVIPDT